MGTCCRTQELRLGLCNNLEGWDGKGGMREAQDGGDLCIPMTHADVWQKQTRYCKPTILQLKINKLKQQTNKNTTCEMVMRTLEKKRNLRDLILEIRSL